jgi:hypothetical protein
MARAKRIAVLTGGGDVPGLNAVIKSVVYRATEGANASNLQDSTKPRQAQARKSNDMPRDPQEDP